MFYVRAHGRRRVISIRFFLYVSWFNCCCSMFRDRCCYCCCCSSLVFFLYLWLFLYQYRELRSDSLDGQQNWMVMGLLYSIWIKKTPFGKSTDTMRIWDSNNILWSPFCWMVVDHRCNYSSSYGHMEFITISFIIIHFKQTLHLHSTVNLVTPFYLDNLLMRLGIRRKMVLLTFVGRILIDK